MRSPCPLTNLALSSLTFPIVLMLFAWKQLQANSFLTSAEQCDGWWGDERLPVVNGDLERRL